MIRKAQKIDLPAIKSLTEACAKTMIENGIFQWNENYPSRERLQQDIERGELFVLEENDEIAGIIVLTSFMDQEYETVEWLTPSKNNLYVHRLATHPSGWGSGFGRQLMDFAEVFAREHHYNSVRLDTFSKNLRNQHFYESRNYTKLGDIYFPKQSEFPFYCYEKLVE